MLEKMEDTLKVQVDPDNRPEIPELQIETSSTPINSRDKKVLKLRRRKFSMTSQDCLSAAKTFDN